MSLHVQEENALDSCRKLTVVGFGEVLWDIHGTNKHLGGATANVAYHAQQFGAEGIIVSCVGQDPDGEAIRNELRAKSLNVDYLLTDSEHATGTVTVSVDAERRNHYVIHKNVAWDYVPFPSHFRELAAKADAVCFGSLAQRSGTSRRSLQAFLHTTRRDCLRVFDVNLRADVDGTDFCTPERVENALAVCDVFKVNNEELPKIAGMLDIEIPAVRSDETLPDTDADDVVARILDQFPLRLVALTRAEQGSVLYTRSRRSEIAGSPLESFVNTVGAGDSFTATLICGLLRCNDLDFIHDLASQVSRYVCTMPEATPTLPASLATALK